MQTEKQQVYHCRGIVKQLNAYIKADKLLILCESDVPAEIKRTSQRNFLKLHAILFPVQHISRPLIIWRQSSDSCIKADVKRKAAC